MSNIPDNLKYAKSHEWVRIEGDTATVGITDHAQAELTDVVFVELPETGRGLAAGDNCAVVESVKTASDLYAPVAGTATLDIAADFQILVAAVDAIAAETRAGKSDALADAPFRRVALLRPLFDRLGMAPRERCCLDGAGLPPPRLVSE